jgi:DNA repair exonuclease SbcCD ATPase subunit
VEAYLFNGDGTPINDGKQKTFDAEIAKRFPSQRVYLSSGFAAQKRGGQFLEISKAERKSLFAEMLGLGYLQTLSETAGKKASGLEDTISGKQAAIAALEAPADRAPSLGRPTQRGIKRDTRRGAKKGPVSMVSSQPLG